MRYFDCSTPSSAESTRRSVAIGDNVTLNCWSGRLESPRRTPIEWTFLGVWAEKPQLGQDEQSLTLHKIAHQEIGVYMCYIWFETLRYRYAHKFELRLLTPLPPIGVRINEIGPCSLLTWKPDGRSDLALAEEGLPQSYKVSYNRWKLGKPIVMTANDTKLLLCDLSPNSLYRVEIKTVSRSGESQPAKYTFRSGNNSESDLGVSYDTQLTVTLGQKLILRCQRKYSKDSEVPWTILTTDDGSNGFLEPYVIDSVRVEDAGVYECKSSRNSGSDDTSTFSMRVSVLVPPKPLTEVKCAALSDGRVIVTWTQAGDDATGDAPTRKAAESLLIRYHKLDGSGSVEWKRKTVSPETTNATIEGLEHGFLYLFRLTAANDAGERAPKSVVHRVI